MSKEKRTEQEAIIERIKEGEEVIWINPCKQSLLSAITDFSVTAEDVKEASDRLQRFAPLMMHYFPETLKAQGMIESPLTPIPGMQARIKQRNLFIKLDSNLAVAGSVKARGGIYEVLKHTEELAMAEGILNSYGDDYQKLATPEAREFFAEHKVQVGSTGNLGLSIGIISAAIGYQAIVHMSADAKQWKKDLLRSKGVMVYEYNGDYSEAVKHGRMLSDADKSSYFVDDENSRDLFCGYAVAGGRLKRQLEQRKINVDKAHPLFVYIPCGVGGAPGGISYGLKLLYGNNVHCFWIEPTQSPCMLIGLETGLHDRISVQDIGLSGKTQADGLAVGRPSAFVSKIAKEILSGVLTVKDQCLNGYMKDLWETEKIFIEPSSCAAFAGPDRLWQSAEGAEYIAINDLADSMQNGTHIVWATGGSLVPEEIRRKLVAK